MGCPLGRKAGGQPQVAAWQGLFSATGHVSGLGKKAEWVSQWYKLCQDDELRGCLATLQAVTRWRVGEELPVLGRVAALSPPAGSRALSGGQRGASSSYMPADQTATSWALRQASREEGVQGKPVASWVLTGTRQNVGIILIGAQEAHKL